MIMAKKSYRKPLNESAAALEQQGKINSLINGDTNYPAESEEERRVPTTNEPPFSAISSPSPAPTSDPAPVMREATQVIQGSIPYSLADKIDQLKRIERKSKGQIVLDALREYVERHMA